MTRSLVLLAVFGAALVAGGCHPYHPVYIYEPVPPPPPGYYVVEPVYVAPPPPPVYYYHPHGHSSFFLHIED